MPLKEEKNDISKTQPYMQFCRHCGKKIEINSMYCKYCGGRIDVSKSGKIGYILLQIKTTIKHMIRKIELMRHSLFKASKNGEKIKGTLKWIAISLVSLAVLIGICSAIWYYIDEVCPQKEAERILANGTSELNNLKGDELFIKCNNII